MNASFMEAVTVFANGFPSSMPSTMTGVGMLRKKGDGKTRRTRFPFP